MHTKVSTFSYNTVIHSFKSYFTALSIVPWVKLSFAAFPRVQRHLRFSTTPVIDLEYFPRRSDPEDLFNSGEFGRHISLVIKSKQLFHIRFCMRFSAMRFFYGSFLSTLNAHTIFIHHKPVVKRQWINYTVQCWTDCAVNAVKFTYLL